MGISPADGKEWGEKAFLAPSSFWRITDCATESLCLGEGMGKTVPSLPEKECEKQGAEVKSLFLVRCYFRTLEVLIIGKM